MRTDFRDSHLSAELMQSFLDRDVSPVEAIRVQEHTASCARCRSELEAWSTLFEGLGELAEVAPSSAFAHKVLGAVIAPRAAVPFRERAVRWLGRRTRVGAGGSGSSGFAATDVSPHLSSGDFQSLLDGDLPQLERSRLDRHLDGCAVCQASADCWNGIISGLGRLPRFAPSADFSERVMAHVRVQLAAESARPRLRELIQDARASGKNRRRVAALAGASITPAVTLVLVAYVVLSHPLASLANVFSFVWLVGSEWVQGMSRGLFASSSGNLLGRAYELVAGLVSSPAAALVSVLGLAGLTFAATWVLYRNVILTPARVGSYAR